jgi:hypothetical protein
MNKYENNATIVTDTRHPRCPSWAERATGTIEWGGILYQVIGYRTNGRGDIWVLIDPTSDDEELITLKNNMTLRAEATECKHGFWVEEDGKIDISSRAWDANHFVKKITDDMSTTTGMVCGASTNPIMCAEFSPLGDSVNIKEYLHGYFSPVVPGETIDIWWQLATDEQKDVATSKLERLHELAGTAWDWNMGNIIMSDNDEMVLIDGQKMATRATALTILDRLTDM